MVTAIQDGTWMDKEGFKNAFIKEEKKRGKMGADYVNLRGKKGKGVRGK